MADPSVFDQMSQVTEVAGSEFDWVEVEGFHEKWPNLADVLFARQIRGEPREAGSLLLFVQDGHIKIRILCPSEGVVAFTTVNSPATLCEELELKLKKGTMDWRVDKKAKGGKKAPF